MRKALFTVIALLCVLAVATYAQDRFLVSPTGEVIPVLKGESVSKVAARMALIPSTLADCPTTVVVGRSTGAWGSNFGFSRGDVFMQRLVTPVAGTIDSIYWISAGLVDPPDSSCAIRIFKSNITDANPGPAWTGSAQNWGNYLYAADPFINKVAAYRDEPGMTPAEQDSFKAQTPGAFDPNGEELWGLGGFIATWHTGNGTVNVVGTADLGSPTVAAGDAFNVCIRVPAADAAGGRTEALANAYSAAAPGFFKFYYFPRTAGNPLTATWWQREFLTSIYVLITAAGNFPPTLESVSVLGNTTSTNPRTIVATAYDCNPQNPADTGVVAMSLFYAVDGGAFSPVAMTSGASGWTGQIPGAAIGSRVQYYVEATDNKGLKTTGEQYAYRLVDLNRAGYQTSYPTYSYVDMSAVTALLRTQFFDGPSQNRAVDDDDGTAGPFDMGGPFKFFGTDYQYAWIGVNGGVGLSASATDTVDVNVGGFFADLQLPDATAPDKFISGWWNDWAPYSSGTGDIKQLVQGTQFIVEWNAVGNFVGTGTSTFQMILDRADNSVTVQFKEIGVDGMEASGMTGLQDTTAEKWTNLNYQGWPAETAPANNKAIKVTYTGTDVEPGDATPNVYALYHNYPNPFNPSTKITYSVPTNTFVTLTVYDLLGREVATLVNGQKAPGTYTVDFDASNLSNGSYFYRLQAGSFVEVKKMMLMK